MKTRLLPPDQRQGSDLTRRLGLQTTRLRTSMGTRIVRGHRAISGRLQDAPRPAIDLLKLAATLTAALVLGLTATYLSTDRRLMPGAVRAGVWTAWPRIGSSGINPYERAAIARTGEIPLGLSEGLMFVAQTDDSGAELSGKCTYRIGGPVPAGRFWTLSPLSPDGRLIANRAKRYGFASQELVRQADGRFEIGIGRTAAPGNWLPLGDVDGFILALRIYDTTLSATAGTLDRTLMPAITRESCF